MKEIITKTAKIKIKKTPKQKFIESAKVILTIFGIILFFILLECMLGLIISDFKGIKLVW